MPILKTSENTSFDFLSFIDSNNTELFINPFKITGVPSKTALRYVDLYVGYSEETDFSGNLVINGVPITDPSMNTFHFTFDDNGKSDSTYVFIEDKNPSNFEIDLTMVYDDAQSGTPGQPDGSVYGKVFFAQNTIYSQLSEFNSNATSLTDTNSAFLLMRTNPMLSGNIKLVADSTGSLYLDTFKVSSNLYKKQYRHAGVSSASNLNTDIRNIFSTLPSSDLYKIPEDDLKAHSVNTDYEKQYDTIYSYGAETNDDELYPENFRMLAPLWMGKNMPDYFVIFKLPGSHSPLNYKGLSDSQIFDLFLADGKMVTSFNMKSSSPLGQYLRNYQNVISNYPGSVIMQFKEQETTNKYANGLNSWIGVSVDTGLFNKLDEISYFANKVITTNSQELMNQFITEGFKRNRLICPQLVNLEFMFNDDDATDFEMNRYFGLYLKENDFLKYDFIEKKRTSNKSIQIKKYDSHAKEVDDTVISGSQSVLNDSTYDDRLFFAVAPDKIKRIKEYNELNNFLSDEAENLPYRNIAQCDARKLAIPNQYDSFVTLHFKKQIKYGEHFRVILPVYSEGSLSIPVIFEFIASNNQDLLGYPDLHAPYIAISNHNSKIAGGVFYRSNKKHDTPKDTSYYDSDFYKATDGQYIAPNASVSQDKIFQYVYAVKYKNKFGAIGKLYETSDSDSSYSNVSSDKYPYIFRMPFYTQSVGDSTKPAMLEEQIERLASAIQSFADDFGIQIFSPAHTADSLSVVSCYDNTYFQHFTAEILNNDAVTINYQNVSSEDGKSVYKYIWDEEKRDSSSLSTDETLTYFNPDFKFKAWPLSNETAHYTDQSIIFAPIDYEVLGWRKSTIVKFTDFDAKTEHTYELSLKDTTIFNTNVIVKSAEGVYNKTDDFSISYYNVSTTDRVDSSAFVPLTVFRSTTNTLSETHPAVMSPFNPANYVIRCPEGADLVNGKIYFYSSMPVNVALMGIMPVRDMDTQIGIKDSEKVSSNIEMHIPANTEIYVNESLKEYSLNSDTYYKLSAGGFAGIGIPMSAYFIIINNVLYYRSRSKGQNVIQSYPIQNGYIRTKANITEDTVITSVPYEIFNNYTIEKPEMNEVYNFVGQKTSNDLKYPFTTPMVCTWKNTGDYYDGDSILNISQVNSPSWKDIKKGYMCFHYPYSGNNVNRFINKSLDSYVKTYSGKVMTIKDYLLNSSISDTMNIFLTERNKPIYTVGYYNKFVNKLEFTVYGIKFSIGFNTNNYIKEIQLSNYNKYEIFILNDFTSRKNEMIINTIENVILIINHNFNFNEFNQKIQTFKIEKNKLVYEDSYNWAPAYYNVDITDSEATKDNIYIPITFLSENSIPITEKSIFEYDVLDGDNGFVFALDQSLNIIGEKYLSIPCDTSIMTNYTDDEYDSSRQYTIRPSFITPSKQLDINAETYLIDPKYDTSSFSELALDSSDNQETIYERMISQYQQSFSADNFRIYVKYKNLTDISVFEIETTSDYSPMTIDFTVPSVVKYNTGFYNPNFIDILEFNLNEEDDLIRRLKTNFILANTWFKKLDTIKNYYGIKTFSNMNTDVTGNRVNYFSIPELSLVKSNWDTSYYRLYSDSDNYTGIEGYKTGIEDKSFFGSKGIKLSGISFEVDEWSSGEIQIEGRSEMDYSSNDSSALSKANYVLTFNLTQMFYNQFTENMAPIARTEFNANWKDFNYDEDAINNYIKLTLIRYFKINNKNNFRIYFSNTVPSGDDIFLKSKPVDTSSYQELKNFHSEIINDNDYIKLKVTLTDLNKTYFATYTLKSNL